MPRTFTELCELGPHETSQDTRDHVLATGTEIERKLLKSIEILEAWYDYHIAELTDHGAHPGTAANKTKTIPIRRTGTSFEGDI